MKDIQPPTNQLAGKELRSDGSAEFHYQFNTRAAQLSKAIHIIALCVALYLLAILALHYHSFNQQQKQSVTALGSAYSRTQLHQQFAQLAAAQWQQIAKLAQVSREQAMQPWVTMENVVGIAIYRNDGILQQSFPQGFALQPHIHHPQGLLIASAPFNLSSPAETAQSGYLVVVASEQSFKIAQQQNGLQWINAGLAAFLFGLIAGGYALLLIYKGLRKVRK